MCASAGKGSVLLQLDLSAAFDNADHSVLLTRLLQWVGITGATFEWCASYLSDRTFSVAMIIMSPHLLSWHVVCHIVQSLDLFFSPCTCCPLVSQLFDLNLFLIIGLQTNYLIKLSTLQDSLTAIKDCRTISANFAIIKQISSLLGPSAFLRKQNSQLIAQHQMLRDP